MKEITIVSKMCDAFYKENKEIMDNPKGKINILDVANGMFKVLETLEKLNLLKKSKSSKSKT